MIKDIAFGLAHLVFWTVAFCLVIWSLTNAYVLTAVVLLLFVFFWIGIYG